MSLDSLPIIAGETVTGHGDALSYHRLPFMLDAERAGPVSRFRLMHKWMLAISSPEAAHELLVERARSFEKSPGLRILLHDVLGDGLFTAEGELWQRQRRLLSPLFHSTPLGDYSKAMHAVARGAVRRMRDGQSLDLLKEMSHITMSVVGATLFGAESFDAQDAIGQALTDGLHWVDEHVASNALIMQVTLIDALERLEPHLPSAFQDIHQRVLEVLEGPVLLPGRHDPKFKTAVRTLDGAIQKLIDDRRASTSERADLLTKLLLARDPVEGRTEGMSDKQIRDESMTLFVAGHETTANALAFSFYLLARNPEARAKVQAEADAYNPAPDAPYDATKLAFTTRVFKEALRLFPPLVMLFRRALEPFAVSGDTYPARTLAMVNVYGIHRSARVWESPHEFQPDRFLPEHEAKRHRSAFLPFGLGPRVCIGNNFALMEGPIVLATLMRAFRFDIDAEREIEADATATLRPKGGVPAVLKNR